MEMLSSSDEEGYGVGGAKVAPENTEGLSLEDELMAVDPGTILMSILFLNETTQTSTLILTFLPPSLSLPPPPFLSLDLPPSPSSLPLSPSPSLSLPLPPSPSLSLPWGLVTFLRPVKKIFSKIISSHFQITIERNILPKVDIALNYMYTINVLSLVCAYGDFEQT